MLRGAFRLLILFDVADAIRLETVRSHLGVAAERTPGFLRPAPEYVRFESPPVVEPLSHSEGRIKYYEYGVVSVELEEPFCCDWPDLIAQSSRWIADASAEQRAIKILRPRLERFAVALVNPYGTWLNEDYYIISLLDAGEDLTADDLLAHHSGDVVQIVRGETSPLSEDERREILQSRISYFPTDLVIAGWNAALVWDTPAGAAPTMQLLEYANTQLLEYRHYDDLLTRVLHDVYASLEGDTTFFKRWTMARRAEQLNTIRLDVMELAERTDNSIKFLSDMFYARLYRLAASRVGVPDYRRLVEVKLRTAGELYEFMMDEFHQARGFVLEVMVVVILIIEIVFLFRGRG